MKETGASAGGKATPPGPPEEKQPMFDGNGVAGLGCIGIVIAVILSCSLSAIFRPSDLSAMRSCAEACGPGRMERYSVSACECIDGPLRLTEPMIPVDAGTTDQ